MTRCPISMCQSLGPKKHDEFSETDRTTTNIFDNPLSSLQIHAS